MRELSVRFVPNLIQKEETAGTVMVMADILRASTTIINALASGASAIYPQAEIEDSRELAVKLGNEALLGGERNGTIIDGFNCGNSPLEYEASTVANRNIVLCTTNGTYTLEFCRLADRILIGAFVNLTAVCQQIQQHEKAIIACAGTNRAVSDEDVLFAGAVTSQLTEADSSIKLDDSARIARTRWQQMNTRMQAGEELWKILAKSHGGRNLMRLGYDHDVKFCSQIDSISMVPELDIDQWAIR